MSDTEFDVVVIGGGPGGYVAAIRATQLGMKTALIEREHLGGICLNWGCIPTKALLRTSEIHHILHNLDEFGMSAKDISFDIGKIVKRSRNVAKQLNQGVAHLLKKNKVTVIDGTGALTGQGAVLVTDNDGKKREIKGTNIILATGARARTLPGMEPDGKRIWTYREAMVPEEMPKSLLVVGSGAIGMEFASFYSDLGADVTIVEVMDRILPVEDAEISGLALKSFEAQGMTIHTGAKVNGLKAGTNDVRADLEIDGKAQAASFDRAILAVGIVGNVEDIGIEGSGVEVDRAHVVVNEWLETGEKGVYAIGDLVGPPWLAHKASHEGVICVEHIAGLETHPLNRSNIPGCTYCRPQIASVGLTEEAAIEEGHEVNVGRFPFMANGKAIALGDPEGQVKTVFDAKTGELLGAHMIGPEVTEMIQGYTVARTAEATEAELMHTVFPHPTLSEAMHESVLDSFGRVIHF
ncbi:MAG: dihydrolipoyl dehydrogenase [Alphaproteobacteria bacterium]|nr:dihydrolipoyl dehydrogenase [Alphaproteobacteria bacterium]